MFMVGNAERGFITSVPRVVFDVDARQIRRLHPATYINIGDTTLMYTPWHQVEQTE